MKIYTIQLDTIVAFGKQIQIEANSEDEAKDKVLELAVEALSIEDYEEMDIVNHDFDIISEEEINESPPE